MADAAHSGTDLVAALLTFFAVGVATKPADAGHLYGHGKAEHLAALAEAAFLVLVSFVLGGLGIAGAALSVSLFGRTWSVSIAGLVAGLVVPTLARTLPRHVAGAGRSDCRAAGQRGAWPAVDADLGAAG